MIMSSRRQDCVAGTKTGLVLRSSAMKTLLEPRGPSSTLVPLLLLLCAVNLHGHRPVIIIHGLFDDPKHFKSLCDFITKAHPGTQVTVIDLFDRLASLKPMWKQVQGFREAVEPVMKKAPDGVHLLCFSQGGLICRALLSTMPQHNVHSFIALSSPLAGQYGDTEYLKWLFPDYIKKTLYHMCYTRYGQRVSICDYWNDPHQRSLYVRKNTFLALLDGDKHHNEINSWRENFLRIKKLVLIGGPDDGVITPWQSSQFGFYDSREHVVEMKNQEFYKNNTFGLKTLAARGDISVCVQAGVQHIYWHSNHTVFSHCIEKWLT